MMLTFLESETSLLDSTYNTAGSAIEETVRSAVIAIVQTIVDTAFPDLSMQTFATCLGEAWDALQRVYLGACSSALPSAKFLFEQEDKNHRARLKLFDDAVEEEKKVVVTSQVVVSSSSKQQKPKPKKSEIFTAELIKAERRRKMAEQNLIIVKLYEDMAMKMKFPLLSGEVSNLYELVLDDQPRPFVATCAVRETFDPAVRALQERPLLQQGLPEDGLAEAQAHLQRRFDEVEQQLRSQAVSAGRSARRGAPRRRAGRDDGVHLNERRR